MATNISNIPAPSREAQAALLRAGTGNWKLVYSGSKWKVVKVENVTSTDITYEQWNAQKKLDAKNAGTVDTSDNATSYQSMKAAEKDPLGKYVVDNALVADVEKGTVKGKDANGTYVDYYLYTQPDGTIFINSSWDAVRKKVITDYQSQPNGINKLFDLLYSKNLISTETYKSKDFSSADFSKGLQYAINRAGVDTLDKRELSGKFGMPTLSDFLTSNGIPSTGETKTTTTRRTQETTRPDADEEADRFFMANVGRNATKAEKDAYFKTLNTAEKKAVVKSTTTSGDGSSSGVDSGTFINETDKALMLGKIAGDAIAGSDLDTIIKSGAGVAQDISAIKTYAKRQGITLSDEQAMGYVADNLRTGKDIKSNQAKLQKLAKIKYSNLADSIDDDTTVEDIASEAMYTVSRLTGIPYKSLSVNSGIIQKVLANNGKPGVMPDYEVAKLVKTDPETKQAWLNSPTAREEAAGYATSILKSFGLI